MKVLFLLPGFPAQAVGGYKTVFELSKQFVKKGLEVEIRYQYCISKRNSLFNNLKWIKNYLIGLIRFFILENRKVSWFYLPENITQKVRLISNSFSFEEYQYVVVTSWETAEFVGDLKGNNDKVVYYIQHDEVHFPNVDIKRVRDTWRLPFRIIVTAQWLEDIATGLGIEVFKIPYGLDEPDFEIKHPIEKRDRDTAVMLYHKSLDKGSQIGIDAAILVKSKRANFKLMIFSVFERPVDLPNWIDFYQSPNRKELSEILNKSSIFIGPSIVEGWGLPGCEAALCGNALCMTDAGGHLEYSFHEETALLCKVNDVEGLAINLNRLIEEDELRYRVAKNANEYISRLTWENTADIFLNSLKR